MLKNVNSEVEQHYRYWKHIATDLSKRYKLTLYRDDLLHFAIKTLIETSPTKLTEINDIKAYVVGIMRTSVTLPNSEFYRRIIRYRNATSDEDPTDLPEDDMTEQERAEPTKRERYDEICEIMECRFCFEDRQFFYFQFKRGWSCKKISRMTGIPYIQVRRRMNEIIEELKKTVYLE